MASKSFKFEKYSIYGRNDHRGEGGERLSNDYPLDIGRMLSDIHDMINRENQEEAVRGRGNTLKEFFQERIRFHHIRKNIVNIAESDEEVDCYDIQLLRLRVDDDLKVADTDGAVFEQIELDGNKYLTESTTYLIIPEKSVVYMQRNQFCITPSVFSEYLNKLKDEDDTIIYLQPNTYEDNIKKINRKKIRRLGFRVKLEKFISENEILDGFLKKIPKFEDGTYVSIEIGADQRKNLKEEDSLTLEDMIRNLYGKDELESLTVNQRGLDGKVEEFDLLDKKIAHWIKLSYGPRSMITHERLIDALFEKLDITKKS